MARKNHIATKSVDTIVAPGVTDWINIMESGILPKSATLSLLLDTASGVLGQVEYSEDASTVSERSVDMTIPDGSDTIEIAIATSAKYVRFNWTGAGTATGLTATAKLNILGS